MRRDDFEFERWYKDAGLGDKDAAHKAWLAGLKYERVECIRLASAIWDSIATNIAKAIRLRSHERV